MFACMTLRTYVFLKFVFIIRNTTSLKTAKTGFAPKIWTCIFTIHLNWFLRTCLWRNNQNRVRLEYIAGSVPESDICPHQHVWLNAPFCHTNFIFRIKYSSSSVCVLVTNVFSVLTDLSMHQLLQAFSSHLSLFDKVNETSCHHKNALPVTHNQGLC